MNGRKKPVVIALHPMKKRATALLNAGKDRRDPMSKFNELE
jgi:hypothetical protein